MKRQAKAKEPNYVYLLVLLCLISIPTIWHGIQGIADTKARDAASVLAYNETFGVLETLAKNVLVEDNSGDIFYEKNGYERVPLASLFKIATILAYIGNTSKDITVTVPLPAILQAGDSGLADGMTFARDDLLAHILMASSNDGIEALALTYKNDDFQTLMEVTQKTLESLGIIDITFNNLTGLDVDAFTDGALGSAYSLAHLVNILYHRAPEIVSTTTMLNYDFKTTDQRIVATENTNHDEEILNRVVFSKTGYTNRAGGNLVVIMPYDGSLYTLVVLGSTYEGRFTDMEHLIATTREYLVKRDYYIEKMGEERYTGPLWHLISSKFLFLLPYHFF